MSKSSELSKRVMTGVLGGVLLLLLTIYGGRLGVAFLTAIISLAMVYEFAEITFNLPDKFAKRNTLLGISWLLAFMNAMSFRIEYELLVLVFMGIFSYFLFTADRHEGTALQVHFQELALSIFSLIYLVFLPFYLPLLRDVVNGVYWTVLFLLIVWAGDTGAYFVGLKYGKRKLYRQMSPKKTVEGAMGGLASGMLVALGFKLIFFNHLPWLALIVIPMLVGAASQVGDLCESFLKRAFDKKDSGTLLPGHGGFLDRFDGVVFSLPVMYACVRLFG